MENEESKESESINRETEKSKVNEESKESESSHRETEDSKEHEDSKETANENKENASEEKERVEESQQKEIKEVVEQSNEAENKEKELESKVTVEDQVNDGNDSHSEEARGEQYKGDNASSEVDHQTQNDTPEEEGQGDLKKSGEVEPVENKEKTQENEVPKVKESDSGENDDSTNVKTSED
ncbi:PROTEIN putative-RELATED, partial [Salix koriyanagi]